MITNDNTLRAIRALEKQDKSMFYGNLDEYLIEVLMSLKMQPTSWDLQQLNKEVQSTLSKLKGSEAKKARTEVAKIISDWDDMA